MGKSNTSDLFEPLYRAALLLNLVLNAAALFPAGGKGQTLGDVFRLLLTLKLGLYYSFSLKFHQFGIEQ